MREILDGITFRDMILTASAFVEENRQKINELNVFPVPDGDTGTNMSLTLGSAADDLAGKKPAGISDAAEQAAGAMLRGARGNSGVILSLLMRGFAKAVKGKKEISSGELAAALNEGVGAAYNAVMKPAEGTILTVSRMAAAAAAEAAEDGGDIERTLEAARSAAEVALAETVEQNPVLKKAGVVDSGGMGYLVILEAFLAALRGEVKTAAVKAAASEPEDGSVFSKFDTEDITFCYCTEFIVRRENGKDPELMRGWLASLGDSLVMLDDDELIKVHVHCNCPGDVITEALTYGSLISTKIENMREQHSSKLVELTEEESAASAPVSAEPEKEYGVVSVCAGDGLAAMFSELGADGVVSGGQTMNPSTDDILRQIMLTPASTVFVLPNNKNIIMAAQQCVGMCDKTVIVVPTASVQQGVAAILALDPGADADANREAMTEAAGGVTSISVTYAARDSFFDSVEIKAGDYLALQDGRLLCADSDLGTVTEHITSAIEEAGSELISIFYGTDVSREQADVFAENLGEALPEAEITLVDGGQPVYYYLISAE
ncbi:MAG: DAK2 domain-containing protein [Oscillospiraceae bacterium]|nr:DAK2 domain-containing protein [Oscillospiraceae bacterium]